MLIVYLIVALAQINHRKALTPEAIRQLTVRMWLFPYASWSW